MADGPHGQDAGGKDVRLQPDAVQEVGVIFIQGAQHAEVTEVQVGIPVTEMEIVQQDLSMPDLYLAGKVLDLESGLVGEGDPLGVAADDPVLDQQVRGQDVGLDFQVVPVDDRVGQRSVSLGLPAFHSGVVDHPEGHSFHLHAAGFQQVPEVLLGFVWIGFLQVEDPLEIGC